MIFIVAETTSKTTERISGTDHQGETKLFGGHNGLFYSVCGVGLSNLLVDFVESVREKLSVFSIDDHVNWSSKYLDTILFKDSGVVELNSAVQCRLTSHRNNNTIWLFLLDDFLDEFRCDGKEENVIRLMTRFVIHVCLNGGDVRVHQNNFFAFFFQSLDCLTTRVVEFSGLSDGRTTTSQKQDLAYLRLGLGWVTNWEVDLARLVAAGIQEGVKHEFSVGRT
mmetsp:Transcript_95927/g.276367  ORF Transcript_95927/g.276367 Transcript_95927/m.276367 type:complete len:223 (+) Transcript_95927:25-693(+)